MGGICHGGICLGGFVRGGFVPGGFYPGGFCPGGGCPDTVYVYSLISHRVQQTSQFTPLVLELSLVRSHLLWGEFSAFSAAIAIHNSPLFVPPGTHHCWVNRGGMI